MLKDCSSWMWIGYVVVISLTALAGAIAGQQKKPKKEDFTFQQPTEQEMQEMQKRWAATMVPGKYHRWLGQLVGKWETTTKMWWNPGGSPAESKGQAEIDWKVKDKWLSWQATSSMMGSPLTMYGFHGYDNFKQKFISLTFDSQTTAAYRWEGNLDQTGTVLTVWGTVDEPMTGEHDKMAKSVIRILGPDKFLHEIHDLTIGGEKTKVIETVYERKK